MSEKLANAQSKYLRKSVSLETVFQSFQTRQQLNVATLLDSTPASVQRFCSMWLVCCKQWSQSNMMNIISKLPQAAFFFLHHFSVHIVTTYTHCTCD